MGTGASTPTANKFLRGNGVGTSAWAQADLTSDMTGVLPVTNGGTGVSTSNALRDLVLGYVYPIGSIYTNYNDSTNPGTLLGFGTWAACGVGKVHVGIDATQTEFDTAGETGGEKTHILTTAEMAAHTHAPSAGAWFLTSTSAGTIGTTAGAVIFTANEHAATTDSVGSNTAHNNLQPYEVVYKWRRTA